MPDSPDGAITVGSICSGIEGAAVAWHGLGWQFRWMYEIDPFCCELLKQKYPGIPNYGDATTQHAAATSTDIIVAGTPCQSFSITGLRKGLDDPRGNVTLAALALVASARPRWFVWENVPGILSSDGGRAFGTFLRALAELGYGFCYRVLDVSAFGVPQRRRRLFLVGHRGGCAGAVAVMASGYAAGPVSGAAAEVPPARVAGTDYGWTGDETPKRQIGMIPTLRALQGGEGTGVSINGRLRKLTSVEMERCQGFPDGYTDIVFNGKQASYAQRKRVLGNAFCVPVVRWIGERIALVDPYVRMYDT